jgi:hypothetical protein
MAGDEKARFHDVHGLGLLVRGSCHVHGLAMFKDTGKQRLQGFET